MNGVKIDAGESYPSNEQFGKWGFSFTTLPQALKKYEEIMISFKEDINE
jgi:hypothetical protein